MLPMRYRFASCTLDTAAHALTRDGRPVPVEPLVFDLLLLLLRHPGELVTRDRMIEEVWHGRIVSDAAVTACVAAARKAVGDDGKTQSVIRTVARRGLQLVAAVETDATADAAPATAPATAPTPAPAVQRIRYTRSDTGHSLAYAVTGEGPPVVRVAALGCDLEVEWSVPAVRALFDLVARRHRLLRLNFVGSGRSDRSMVRTDFDMMADDLRAAADAAGFDRFALYSESGGAHVALRFAARHPDRVSRLAILGGYVHGRALRRGTDASEDALRRMIAEGWEEADLTYGTAFMLAYFPEGPLDSVRDLARMMQAGTSLEAELAIRDAVNAVDNTDILSRVACPTLVVHARGDAVHPLTEAQKLAAGIPDAELVVMETANHLPLPGTASWDSFVDTFLPFLGRPDTV